MLLSFRILTDVSLLIKLFYIRTLVVLLKYEVVDLVGLLGYFASFNFFTRFNSKTFARGTFSYC